MEEPIIHTLSDEEVINLAIEVDAGGDYESARHLIDREMSRRALHVTADPTGLYDASEDHIVQGNN